MNKFLWHNLPEKEIFALLKSTKSGLTENEAIERQKKYGLNKLPEGKRLAWFFVLFNQFKSPMIYILVAAALVSFFLHEYVDMVVILAAVFVNTLVGFIQENKAEKTMQHLKKIISYKSRVLRNGQEMLIDSAKIVIGDIVLLEAGARVPADGRIFELNDLQINEASLTGESMPVSKELKTLEKGANLADRKNMVFMGTVVTRGRAKAIITGTGLKTHLGEIAALVKETTEDQTPLQYKLQKFSHLLGAFVLIVCFFIFLLGVFFGNDTFEMFETAVAIAVAAIPEGLIVSVTIILTVGMQRILRKKALVRKLIAVETLGSVSVICTDKTGTLTEGIMRVAYLLTGNCDPEKDSISPEQKQLEDKLPDHYLLLKLGIICNNAIISTKEDGLEEEFIGDSTESALLRAGIDIGYNYQELRDKYSRIAEIPFSTEIKYMATLNNNNEGKEIYLKGAPEKILNSCTQVLLDGKIKKLDNQIRKQILHNFDKLTSKGLRVLGAGYKAVAKDKTDLTEKDIGDFVFLGVFALKDSLRKEAKNTIDICKAAGIRPIIITGDHRLTVKALAQEIGLKVGDDNLLEGNDLDKMSDEELRSKVKEITVYARVSPKHKLRIVDAWQSHGEVVAMLGDGVNDAPALKSADVGVAVGSGTDVAKESAEIVLLNNNFRTIVDAVNQGRIIFDNIRKVITYLLSASFTEIILITGALVFQLPLPVLALQILYVNIITDGFPGITLTFEPGEKNIMSDKPRKKTESILNKEMKLLIFIIGIFTDLILFTVYIVLLKSGEPIEHIRTIIFTALACISLMYIFSIKSLRTSIFHINLFSNKYLILAIAGGFVLILLAVYNPVLNSALELSTLNLNDWLLILGLGLVNILLIELGKFLFIHKIIKND